MSEKSVVCAIDVNEFDQDVVDLAASFAEQFQCDLDLLHVTLFPDPDNAAWPGYLGSPNTIIHDNRRLRAVSSRRPDVLVHHHHLTGIPTDKILEFIHRKQPTLVVLGTHGRTGLARILGSVATQILRKAECPVMILRQKQNSQEFVNVDK